MAEMSRRAYARYRQERGLPGGAPNAVNKAVNSGRIKLTANGLIDSDQADAAWERNTDEGHRRNVEDPKPKAAARTALLPEAPPSDQQGSSYQQARAVREVFQARTARLEYERLTGKLVPADEIEARWAALVTDTRNRLLGVPSKARVLIPQLTFEDIGILTDLIREALEDLAGGTMSNGRERAA